MAKKVSGKSGKGSGITTMITTQSDTFSKGLVKDYDDVYFPESCWSHARNAVNNSTDGNVGVLGNEPSNTLCVPPGAQTTAPYQINGAIHVYDDKWVITSGENGNSEVGLFMANTCSYHTIVNDPCLNFTKYNIVIGEAKQNYDCSFQVYFVDGNNPDRTLNIGDIRVAPFEQPWPGVPYITQDVNSGPCEDCKPIYPLQLDCEKIRIAKIVKTPCIELTKSLSGGTLLNGSYFAFVAYALNGERVTDYYPPSNIQSLFNHDNISEGLQLVINDMETDLYDQFELVIVKFVNQQTVAKRIGLYSTNSRTVEIPEIPDTLQDVPLPSLVVRNAITETSEGIFSINDYLIRTSPKSRFSFNYQPLANQISAKWVVTEYPADYYFKGGNVNGYMRDEIYAFFIRWVYNTGDTSSSYHIPGRPAYGWETAQPSITNDVINNETAVWQVYNTAFITDPGLSITQDDGGIITAKGRMGYWQSTEIYPNNQPVVWDANNADHPWTAPASYPYPNTNLNSDYDLCGKALRHHKMPADIIFYNSNGSVSYNDASNHIVSNADNSPARIRVLGVEFDNILPPLDNQGNVIPGIVGYEILRSSRQGNKTVIAKGIINNVRSYKEDKDGADEILYQNYPYNSLQPDPSLSTKDIPGGPSDNGQLYPPPSKVFRDIFTFHSPDTQVISPYLTPQEVVLYGQRGYTNNVNGAFSEVPEHPRHKLITDLAFSVAVVIGMAEAMIKARGRKTRSQQGPKELWLGQYNESIDGNALSGGGGTWVVGGAGTQSPISGGAISGLEGSTPNKYWDSEPIPDSAKFEVPLYVDGQIQGPGSDNTVESGINDSNNLFSLGGNNQAWNAILGFGQNYDVTGFYHTLSDNQFYKDSKVKIGFSENLDLELSGQQMLDPGIASSYGIVSFMSYWGMGLSNFVELIKASTKYRQYAYRYLSHGDLTNNTIGNVQIGNHRRKVERSYYLDNLLQTFPASDSTQVSYRVNNLYRGRAVMFEASNNIADPSIVDNSLTTIGVQFDIDNDTTAGLTANEYDFLDIVKQDFDTTASSYYAGFKIRRPNLYGQIDSILQVPSGCRTIVKPIDGNFGSCSNTTFLTLTQNDKGKKVPGSIVYGGDVYIGRYTEKNTFFYFRDWLYGQPDGTQFDYGLHYMISYPRYWANLSEYDAMGALGSMVGDLLSLGSVSSNTWDIPSNYHHLDRRNYSPSGSLGGGGTNFNVSFRFGVKNAFFYLFQSGVRDFFVETELNISYRDWGNQDDQRFYDPYRYADTEALFEPSIIKAGNFFKYDMSLGISKTYHDLISWGNVQPISYNPYVAEKCFTYYPNRLIYSLPQSLEAIRDYWQVFLAFNYKDFRSKVISVKPYDQSGVIIFTEKDSPVMTRTVENLELDLGTKLNIGDGSLFSQPLQSFSNADAAYQYASVQDPLSVVNTPLGLYYVAQSQGKIFGIGQSLEEISTAGLKWWFAKYLPYKLLEDFPDFELVRNPIAGIGCQASFDNKNQIVYFTKRDFKLRIDAPSGLVYDKKDIFNKVINGQVTSITVALGDPLYFEDASWTVSYDPKAKAFISFHDWHPDLIMPSKMSILTTKGPNIWKHNESTSSYTNFYGVDYPFEVEEVVSNGQTVTSIKSMEYILEAYVYSQDGYDRFHVLDYNFNKAIVYNSEQVSGELRLNLHPKNNPVLAMQYPTYTPTYVDILYSKEENKYRFNQFVDLTRDRGEYTGFVTQMWDTQANGYISLLNPNNINYSKPAFQRKKFRHYVNRLKLIRENAPGQNNTKMLYKINNMKQTLSPR
jgi:hypothetical protein